MIDSPLKRRRSHSRDKHRSRSRSRDKPAKRRKSRSRSPDARRSSRSPPRRVKRERSRSSSRDRDRARSPKRARSRSRYVRSRSIVAAFDLYPWWFHRTLTRIVLAITRSRVASDPVPDPPRDENRKTKANSVNVFRQRKRSDPCLCALLASILVLIVIGCTGGGEITGNQN